MESRSERDDRGVRKKNSFDKVLSINFPGRDCRRILCHREPTA